MSLLGLAFLLYFLKLLAGNVFLKKKIEEETNAQKSGKGYSFRWGTSNFATAFFSSANNLPWSIKNLNWTIEWILVSTFTLQSETIISTTTVSTLVKT